MKVKFKQKHHYHTIAFKWISQSVAFTVAVWCPSGGCQLEYPFVGCRWWWRAAGMQWQPGEHALGMHVDVIGRKLNFQSLPPKMKQLHWATPLRFGIRKTDRTRQERRTEALRNRRRGKCKQPNSKSGTLWTTHELHSMNHCETHSMDHRVGHILWILWDGEPEWTWMSPNAIMLYNKKRDFRFQIIIMIR